MDLHENVSYHLNFLLSESLKKEGMFLLQHQQDEHNSAYLGKLVDRLCWIIPPTFDFSNLSNIPIFSQNSLFVSSSINYAYEGTRLHLLAVIICLFISAMSLYNKKNFHHSNHQLAAFSTSFISHYYLFVTMIFEGFRNINPCLQ